MSRKGKPATLTSSLLARKGEAEPARLQDGSIPKDVMALQEELVARVGVGIGPAGPARDPVDIAPRMPGQAAPKLPIDRVFVGFSSSLDRNAESGYPAAPELAAEAVEPAAAENDAKDMFEPAAEARSEDEPDNDIDDVLDGPSLAAAESEAEAMVAAPPAAEETAEEGDEAPVPAAQAEEPDMDATKAVSDPVGASLPHDHEAEEKEPDEEDAEPAVTLADWTERVRMLEHHPIVAEREEEDDDDERRSSKTPLALTIVVLAAVAGFALWRYASEGEVIAPVSAPETASNDMPAAAPPVADNGSPAGAPVAAAPPASDSLPALGPTEHTGAPKAAPQPQAAPPAKPDMRAEAKPEQKHVSVPAAVRALEPKAQPAGGAYAIQLVSTVSQELAEQAWTKLQPRFSTLASAHPHEIAKADLGAKGTRYRVMLTGFASLADARTGCKTVEGKGQSCLVMRR